jgi:CO/xanthine dehydrogenase Mo-binding subunit
MTSQAPTPSGRCRPRRGGAGLPIYEHNIRVVTHDIGGGFGGKVPVYPGYVLAVAASFLTGKPVKWIEDRSENLQADSFARDYHIHAEMGATKDGKITASRSRRWPTTATPTPPRTLEVPGRPVQRDHRQSTTSTTRSSRSMASTRTSRPAAWPTAARSA